MDADSERTRDVLALGDERIAARFADVHRRIHKDIAASELRVTKIVADSKESMLRWFITIFVLQAGFTFFMAWASRHLFA